MRLLLGTITVATAVPMRVESSPGLSDPASFCLQARHH